MPTYYIPPGAGSANAHARLIELAEGETPPPGAVRQDAPAPTAEAPTTHVDTASGWIVTVGTSEEDTSSKVASAPPPLSSPDPHPLMEAASPAPEPPAAPAGE